MILYDKIGRKIKREDLIIWQKTLPMLILIIYDGQYGGERQTGRIDVFSQNTKERAICYRPYSKRPINLCSVTWAYIFSRVIP